MELMLFLFSLLLALAAFTFNKLRFVAATVSIMLHGLASGMLFADHSSLPRLFFLFFSIFQLFNIARLLINRLHHNYLRKAFLIGGGRLFALQTLCLVVDFGLSKRPDYSLTPFFVLQVLLALSTTVLIVHRLIASTPRRLLQPMSDTDLPTISVLIPARDESDDLEALLHCIVANDYPKLEVLVLDDNSGSTVVSDIVRKFAHDGVRFIQGDVPDENWLAKNQAYHTLAEASSGSWLMFMGVDVRLGVSSIRVLINYAQTNHAAMLSVMPRRFGGNYVRGFFSPLRYWRELTHSPLTRYNVPALSTLWLISRDAYVRHGGMRSVARKIIPEQYFARTLRQEGGYKFVRSNDLLQVSTAKSLKEQFATALRVAYPGHHRRMEFTALSILFFGLFYAAPFVQVVYGFVAQHWLIMGLSLSACVLLVIGHLAIVGVTNPVMWPLGAIHFPYLIVQEMVLDLVSMYKYEFGEIFWKRRNICLPVMHVIPRLPPLDERAAVSAKRVLQR
jgi:hypothetical protein